MPLPPDFTLLQVVPELETGGAEQSTIDVAHAVVRAGGAALVATRGGRMTARLEADGGRLAQMPVQTKNPLTMLGNAARLVSLIRQEKVSIVHARSRAPAFSALWAAHATGTPFVATYHGVYKAQSGLKRWYNAIMTRGDLVIANSDYTRDHVLSRARHRPRQAGHHPAWRRPGPLRPRLGDACARRGPARRLGNRGRRPPHAHPAGRAADPHQGPPDDRRGRPPHGCGRTRRLPDPLRRRRPGPHGLRRRGAGRHRCGRPVGRHQDRRTLRRHAGRLPAGRPGHPAHQRAGIVRPRRRRAPGHGPHGDRLEPRRRHRDDRRRTTGWLAPVEDAEAWAAALGRAIDLGPTRRKEMGEIGRNRARQLYSADAMCAQTLAAYERVLEARR